MHSFRSHLMNQFWQWYMANCFGNMIAKKWGALIITKRTVRVWKASLLVLCICGAASWNCLAFLRCAVPSDVHHCSTLPVLPKCALCGWHHKTDKALMITVISVKSTLGKFDKLFVWIFSHTGGFCELQLQLVLKQVYNLGIISPAFTQTW